MQVECQVILWHDCVVLLLVKGFMSFEKKSQIYRIKRGCRSYSSAFLFSSRSAFLACPFKSMHLLCSSHVIRNILLKSFNLYEEHFFIFMYPKEGISCDKEKHLFNLFSVYVLDFFPYNVRR